MSKVVPAPQVWMVALPETAGVHWKTCSGAVLELPQLPASALVPLVAPLTGISVPQGLVPSKTEIANTAMLVVFLRREVRCLYAERRMAGSSRYDENMDTWPKTMQSSTHTRRGRPWSERPGFD